MSEYQLNWTTKKKKRMDKLRTMQINGEFLPNAPEQRELAALSMEYALWSKQKKQNKEK